jgi:hypothetical protein
VEGIGDVYRFALDVFESGGDYSGGGTGKTTILLRPAVDQKEARQRPAGNGPLEMTVEDGMLPAI